VFATVAAAADWWRLLEGRILGSVRPVRRRGLTPHPQAAARVKPREAAFVHSARLRAALAQSTSQLAGAGGASSRALAASRPFQPEGEWCAPCAGPGHE
jgi:hypothetical protein